MQPVHHSASSGVDPARAPAVRPRLRGRLHAAAAALSVGALVWLVRSAGTTEALIAAWVYGVAALLCYGASTSYHVLARTDRARTLLRRADHSMIYVLIAGTITPICLLAMTGQYRWFIIGIVWVGALFGVMVALVPIRRLHHFGTALYLILGWAALATFPALSHHPTLLVLVVLAGLLYTVGAALFGSQRPKLRPAWFGYHEFWHCMVIAAGALLFAVNLSLVAGHTS
jgi:hemolysin III